MEGKIALGSYHWRRSVVFIINCDDIKHTDLEFLKVSENLIFFTRCFLLKNTYINKFGLHNYLSLKIRKIREKKTTKVNAYKVSSPNCIHKQTSIMSR